MDCFVLKNVYIHFHTKLLYIFFVSKTIFFNKYTYDIFVRRLHYYNYSLSLRLFTNYIMHFKNLILFDDLRMIYPDANINMNTNILT